MSLKITATAQPKIIYSCDRTGKRLSPEEIERQEKSVYVGEVTIELSESGRKFIDFRLAVINGKEVRKTIWPTQADGQGGTKPAFGIDLDLMDEVNKLALSAMRKALSNIRGTNEVEL